MVGNVCMVETIQPMRIFIPMVFYAQLQTQWFNTNHAIVLYYLTYPIHPFMHHTYIGSKSVQKCEMQFSSLTFTKCLWNKQHKTHKML